MYTNIKLAITGVGIVSPLGIGKEKNWKQLINCNHNICYNKNLDTNIATLDNLNVPNNKRQYQMAMLAINEALEDTNIANSFSNKTVGFCLGESKINLFNNPFKYSLLEKLNQTFHFNGNLSCVSAACATGILTIIQGCKLIENGNCNTVVCGCSETSIHPLYISGFKNMGVLTKRMPSPFDKDRDGFAIGEGACFIVIERLKDAIKNNLKIYAEIESFSNGIYSDNTLSIGSPVKMKQIIKKAVLGHTPDYIHMHGTATKLNDYNESKAVFESFTNTSKISLSSTKASTGHMLSVSAMAGTVFSLLAMKYNIVPPTLNFKQTDINLNLDYTPNKPKAKIINSSLILSFGFGGQSCALFLKKYKCR
jgi:3-oxoacyl-(acyl-carrier-protein) synthase